MNLKTLIKEPVYLEVLDILIEAATKRNYSAVEPTSMISSFWSTTFTPSSSEIIFRHLTKPEDFPQAIYTCQPCIRITDLPKLNDGWHFVLFHMFTYVTKNLDNLQEEIFILLDKILFIIGYKIEQLIFTVSNNPLLDGVNTSFGYDLLLQIGVPKKNIIFCQGKLNYQNTSLITLDKQKASMIGPKIEIYIRGKNSLLYEIGTMEIANADLNSKVSENVFAMAFGLERVSTIKSGYLNLNFTSLHTSIIQQMCDKLLHHSMAKTSIGTQAMSEVLSVIDALWNSYHAMSQIENLNSLSKRNNNRGIGSHYKKIVKSLDELSLDYGIRVTSIIDILTDELLIDMRSIFPSNLFSNF